MANPSVADSSAHDNSKSQISCNQCQLLGINGTPCHERGCPNSRKSWVPDRGDWVLFVRCFHCGCDVEAGTNCGCCEETEAR